MSNPDALQLKNAVASVHVSGVRFASFGDSGWYRWTGANWGPIPSPLYTEPILDALARREDEVAELRAVVDALLDRPFRGTPAERRDRLCGTDWTAVHDALDALTRRILEEHRHDRPAD